MSGIWTRLQITQMEMRIRPRQCSVVVITFVALFLVGTKPSASHPYAYIENGERLRSETITRKLSRIHITHFTNGKLASLGILDTNGGFLSDIVAFGDEAEVDLDVDVGDVSERFSLSSLESNRTFKSYNFDVCAHGWKDYIPCLDNAGGISELKSNTRGEIWERHCPRRGSMCCLIGAPLNYKLPIRWPKSSSEIWYNNVPHAQLLADKSGENWIKLDKDRIRFPSGDIQSENRVHQYLDHISEMLPTIGYGRRTRVALDIGCGVASFGAYLFDRDVITLSIAPKDGHESQFALERGVPALVAVLATRRLLFPSQAFDLIHCSGCQINWNRDDGILLIEVDRVLRAGAYFVWSPQEHQENVWREMEDLAKHLCWEQVGKDGQVGIWRKPLNHSCLKSRSSDVLCDPSVNPDETWYVSLQSCLTLLPENGLGGDLPEWPARLSTPPRRLETIVMDATQARSYVFKSDQRYWHVVVEGYLRGLGLHKEDFRNIMDMRAMYGGFAAGLVDQKVDWWVMNVVPISGQNTLPVIFDRGLIGVSHDWCEPFDTYPRTYDLLHAVGLLTQEDKRCNIAHIVLEMDRILRPGGWVLVRETNDMVYRVEALAKSVRWKTRILETESGPFGKDKLLSCQKPLWHS
ncbi:probable methyltransferase PMT11 isoform X1 [Physcomitrium patens]|uniref:Methyltransferase n=2 Tax=Physcomitrium patens TaxID=3218 RepID=A0A7I4DUY0_PHYPA|nr:probable methyltransferase PMT11 isoform X1 [Physcomitrium patens]|eukprot:XP_024376976.1 probable methyltransferase PMT11 isoform X1 [Physcomitrella patens]